MSAPGERRRTSRSGVLPLALQYASNVYEAIDRRMPEAVALAAWLAENATDLACLKAPCPTTMTRAARAVAV